MLGAIPWILLGLPLAIARDAEFFKPGPPPYPTWEIGETQTIRYRTSYKEYNIALWQGLDGAANLGPILYQTTNGADKEESTFEWLVQNYDLDLDVSSKFFLWLFEGPPSRQGNFSYNQQSSGEFTIVEADKSTKTTTTAEVTTTSSAASSSVTLPSSLTLPFTETTTTTTGTAETTSSDAQNSDDGGGLSVGAQAGIGVGVGVAGLAIIAALIFFFIKYRNNKRQLEEMQQQQQAPTYEADNQMYQPYPPPSTAPPLSQMSKTPMSSPSPHQPPSELDSNNNPATELPG